MTIKNFLLLSFLWAALPFLSRAQVSGNANYQQRSVNSQVEIPTLRQNHNPEEVTLTLRAMYNVRASSYVAVFSLVQVGETIEETDNLINERLDKIKKGLSQFEEDDIQVLVDMISLVPLYEYEVEKKIFSKNTYTEVPKGFEMMKNLHIRYTQPGLLDKFVSICARNQVYDLIKVDYFVENKEAIYDSLRKASLALLRKKIAFYKEAGIDLSAKRKILTEGQQTYFPTERYSSYQAFTNYSLEIPKDGEVKNINKTTAQYYRPVSSRYYDIVVNPEILEPALQYTYSMEVKFYPEEEEKEKEAPAPPPPPEIKKKVYLILPNGSLKELDL